MSECAEDLRKAGKAHPRTCAECGLGPCKRYPPKSHMYRAEYNLVFDEKDHLVLTVHPRENQARTPTEQAAALTRMLNSDASLRYRIFGGA
jgi:hypothetical protein